MALIKCKECGHMISDKATKCPKCGCPIIIENETQYSANVSQQPVYYNENNKGNRNKWLYGIVALVFVALVVGGGYWWYSQSQENQKIQHFVELFAKAVENGDSLTLHTLYPDSECADSLYIPSSEPLISKIKESNEFKVEWNKDLWIELSPQGKDEWTISASQGVFAWPKDVMDFAMKTGQWKSGLTDKDISTRMKDINFKKSMIDGFCSNFKRKVIQKGSLSVLKESKFEDDPWTLGSTIANTNDIQISGSDYKITMMVWDQYLYNNNLDEKEAWKPASIQGKDIAPNSETVISHSLEGFQGVKDSSVKIQWNINDQQLFNKYFVAKGNEYDEYLKL